MWHLSAILITNTHAQTDLLTESIQKLIQINNFGVKVIPHVIPVARSGFLTFDIRAFVFKMRKILIAAGMYIWIKDGNNGTWIKETIGKKCDFELKIKNSKMSRYILRAICGVVVKNSLPHALFDIYADDLQPYCYFFQQGNILFLIIF